MNQTHKSEPPPEPKKKKRPGVRLNRPEDVKRLLNKGINQVLGEEMDTDTLRAVTYACQTILKVFEIVQYEERMVRIEERLKLL